MERHPHILQRERSALLIVDVQEKINAVMRHGPEVVSSVVKLIEACKILNLPIFVTEQYPKGLGSTEPEILQALGDTLVVQKMTFSCCGEGQVLLQLQRSSRQQVVLVGIEAHVCVQQTALDLLHHGYQVHIPKDAVSSRKKLDYKTALDRLSREGAIITTVESVLFEWLVEAGTPEFKQISKLIK